jgi:hypothetical protein
MNHWERVLIVLYTTRTMIQWWWYLLNVVCRIVTSTFHTNTTSNNHERTVSMVRHRSVMGLVHSIDTYRLVACVTRISILATPQVAILLIQPHLAEQPVNFSALSNLHIIASLPYLSTEKSVSNFTSRINISRTDRINIYTESDTKGLMQLDNLSTGFTKKQQSFPVCCKLY